MLPERVFPARPKIGWSPCPVFFSRSHTARVMSQPSMGSILQSVIVRSNTGTMSSLMASAVLPSSQNTTSCPRSASLWPRNNRQAALPSTICIFNFFSDGNRGSDEVRRLAFDCFYTTQFQFHRAQWQNVHNLLVGHLTVQAAPTRQDKWNPVCWFMAHACNLYRYSLASYWGSIKKVTRIINKVPSQGSRLNRQY